MELKRETTTSQSGALLPLFMFQFTQTSFDSRSPSALRKKNLDLDVSDPKYDGVKTTRRQLLEESDHDSIPEDDSLHSDADSNVDDELGHDSASDSASEDEDNVDNGIPKAKSPSPESDAEDARDDMTSALQQSRLADRQKGKAITRQLVCSIPPCLFPITLAHRVFTAANVGYDRRCTNKAPKGRYEHQRPPSCAYLSTLLFLPHSSTFLHFDIFS